MKATYPAAHEPACELIGHEMPRTLEPVPETTPKDQPHESTDSVPTRAARLLAAYEYTALSH
jgi:hypothetical protein